MACERNQGVMDDSKIFGLNNWGSQHYQNGETQEGRFGEVGRGASEVHLGHENFSTYDPWFIIDLGYQPREGGRGMG